MLQPPFPPQNDRKEIHNYARKQEWVPSMDWKLKIKGKKANCPQRLTARKGRNGSQDATNSEVRDAKSR